MREIKEAGGKRIRLDAVAEGTLGKKKSGSGLQAVQLWKEGKIDKLKAYCLDDVKLTKELYDYAREHNSLKYTSLGDVREIKLDTSRWEEIENVSMTYTLPF